jgi:L1 cell adhesion molecule like protein
MYQLRNLINRRSVVSDVSKDMNSCEDFLELVTKAHIVAAAISLVGAEDVANLSENILSGNSSSTLHSVAKSICAKLVTITFQAGHTPSSQNPDHVLEYAKETLSLGLLYLEFKDAIREGDGERVLRCWKYFWLFFRATGHTNYCLEAFNTLMQYYYILPPRYAEEMLWGRFINARGKAGHNISADLHMEHLNRHIKDSVRHLGANKTPQAVKRAGK